MVELLLKRECSLCLLVSVRLEEVRRTSCNHMASGGRADIQLQAFCVWGARMSLLCCGLQGNWSQFGQVHSADLHSQVCKGAAQTPKFDYELRCF